MQPDAIRGIMRQARNNPAQEAAAKTQARIDTGQQTVVGVNRYLNDTPDDRRLVKVV